MKKEVIIAIFIGICIGLVITFGIRTAQQSLNRELQNPQPELTTSTPDVPETPSHLLLIASPKNGSIIDETKVNISGSTTPYALVGLLSGSDQNQAMADSQGNFSISIALTTGVNVITVTSFADTGEGISETIRVVQYDHNFSSLGETANATASPTPKGAKI